MANEIRKIVSVNVKLLRKNIGLSQLKFALFTGISKASIINIESSKTGYNFDLLNAIAEATNTQIADLCDPKFKCDYDIRSQLLFIYSGNIEKSTLLSAKPEITFAIERKLLQGDFMVDKREISEIRNYLKQYNWEYLGTSISNGLKNMTTLIKIEPHPSKKGTFIYSKKLPSK